MVCSSTLAYALIIAVAASTADLATAERPVPGQIIGPFEGSVRLSGDYFHYEFNFSVPEDWKNAKPVADYSKGKFCTQTVLPPVPNQGKFQNTTLTRYVYRTQVHKSGFACWYNLQIYLKSREGVKGIPYLTHINLTDCRTIEGMQCTDEDRCIVPGFKYINSTGRCYMAVYRYHDWYSAASKCNELYSTTHLVAITSAEENSAVKTYLSWEIEKNPTSMYCRMDGAPVGEYSYWTSGQQLIKGDCSSPFAWKKTTSDDQAIAFDFTSWNETEPNCGSDEEYCTVIQAVSDFHWFDEPCSKKTCPLCEYSP